MNNFNMLIDLIKHNEIKNYNELEGSILEIISNSEIKNTFNYNSDIHSRNEVVLDDIIVSLDFFNVNNTIEKEVIKFSKKENEMGILGIKIENNTKKVISVIPIKFH